VRKLEKNVNARYSIKMPKYSESFVILLAAGAGKRMRSSLPKVLHECLGRPMLEHSLEKIIAVLPNASIGVVVGHGREEVSAFLEAWKLKTGFKNLKTITQENPQGTGHALQSVALDSWGKSQLEKSDSVLVFPGDLPLLSRDLIQAMVDEGTSSGLLLTTELENPTGYGRVMKKGTSSTTRALKIVEEKDASEKQRKIKEVACSIYRFSGKFLLKALPKLKNLNAQKEYYLTDLIEIAAREKKPLSILKWKDGSELRGVNDFWELSLAEKTLQEKVIEKWARNGVRFMDPWSVVIEEGVKLNPGIKIHRGVVLRGKTSIGEGADIGANSVLKNTLVGPRAQVKAGTYSESSEIGEEAQVGPYAHLRPESRIGKRSKVGNFVELKKTTIGENTSVAHLSYLGDATVGSGVNIGCGFVTCNYDGRVINGSRKHPTVIEDDCFIGSDCQVIAPIRIEKGAYIASGSTVNRDVPADALAIGRSRQENKEGYALRLRPKKESDKK
jgi:bifunctional UDP-N-acetylglucosamine pyrophosphorylase / glucosamine-1-phosphate N-acetyltransferase